MSDVTQVLQQIESGDPSAAEQLLPLVYEELKKLAAAKMANERSDHTLQATALVHEAYVRLVDTDNAQHWNSSRHFFLVAAESMRRILVESARRKKRLKRGGIHERVALSELVGVDSTSPEELLDLDDALQRFAIVDPERAEVVNLRYFAGLSIEDVSRTLGLSEPTVKRYWRYARAWLHRKMQEDSDS